MLIFVCAFWFLYIYIYIFAYITLIINFMSRGKSVIRALYIPALERYVSVSKQTIDEINRSLILERKDQRFTHFLHVAESNGSYFYEIKLKDNEIIEERR